MINLVDRLLELRHTFTTLFEDYKGDVVVEEFLTEIDQLLKEVTK